MLNNNFVEQKQNQLECICLLLTGFELEDGTFDHFMRQIETVSLSSNENILKNINFIILYSDDKVLKKDFSIIKNKFLNFHLQKIEIPIEYDFYVRDHNLKNIGFKELNLDYGLKSGANFVFFNCFNYLEKFNTTLFLECDCFFGKNWLERIFNYVKFAGGFWISGSVYDNEKQNINSISSLHLNGGTSLYATSNVYFRSFFKKCHINFKNYIKNNLHYPYDYYIRTYIENNFNSSEKQERYYWSFVRRQYLTCNLIYNYSPSFDNKFCVEKLLKRHDFAILHKKI